MEKSPLFLILLFSVAVAASSCGKSNPAGPGLTPQPTGTATVTASKTASAAITVTFTQTVTITHSPTETNTPVDTDTVTSTDTPQDTPTETCTMTVTESASCTVTDTSTGTATETQADTATCTPSCTGTVTETETTADTATETATSTITDTATETSTYTITGTATPTPTFTVTSTPMPLSTWVFVATPSNITARYAHAGVAYNGKMWVIGGYDGVLNNDVYSSSDGMTWSVLTSAAAFVKRDYFQALAFNNGTGEKLWIIGGGRAGGYNSDVWYSTDGAAWGCTTTAAGFVGRFSHSAAVYNDGSGDKMWVIGGYDGVNYLKDVWSSSNGVDWTPATQNAAFGVRDGAVSLSYGGLLWVIGGLYNDGTTHILNDVWYSTNGADWLPATQNAAFGPRTGHAGVVYDGKMWIIGGLNAGAYNDAWYSTDGANWTQATTGAPVQQRAYHTAVVLNGKVYIMLGVTSGAIRLNDVWAAQ